jgi:hypothetical protein
VAIAFPDVAARTHGVLALIALAYLVTSLLMQAARLTQRSWLDATRLRPAPEPKRPEELARFERSFGWKSYSPRDFDFEVRPALRRILETRTRLAHMTGSPTPLDDPELARVAGDEPTERTSGRSITTQDIARIVDKIGAP